MLGFLIGEITAYHRKRGLATVRLRGRLLSGNHVHIVGPTTDCEVSADWEDLTRIVPGVGEDPLMWLMELGIGRPNTSDWR